MSVPVLNTKANPQLFNPDIEVVPSATDKALLFTMSQQTGHFILDAINRSQFGGESTSIIRKGYGHLVRPDGTQTDSFHSARLAKGRVIYKALDQLRVDSDCRTNRMISAVLQRQLGEIAGTLVEIDPLLKRLTNKAGVTQYDPEAPRSFWQSGSIESYLHHPLIAPHMDGYVSTDDIYTPEHSSHANGFDLSA